MITYALDFETFYSKECSIKTLGPRGYFSHPDFDAYLVTVVGGNGYRYAGHPSEFDWSLLDGQRVLSHNASFDESLTLYGVEQGWWPACSPAEWHCTADMVACLGFPRSLKNASAAVFGLEVSKTTRDNMSGKSWSSMTPKFQKEVIEYAIKDSELCLRLWQELSDKWSEFERKVSATNRKIMQRGIPMDADAIQRAVETLNVKLFEAESCIPWLGDKPLLSRPAFDNECRKVGIEPPKSLAEGDAQAEEFLEKYGQQFLWVNAVKNWRRINALKKKVESFAAATMADHRYYGGIMYWGSHTGRFSGSGGNLNLQNLPRDEMFGVNLRHLIKAAPGKKLIAVDLSQIEVRTLCWLAKDVKTMEEIRNSDDFYGAFAVRFGLWSPEMGSLKKKDPELRHKVKGMVLGCGYGAGADKYSKKMGCTLAEAERDVGLYRAKMKPVTRLWDDISSDIRVSYDLRVPLEFDLPSGRKIKYGHVKQVKQNGRLHFVTIMNREGKRLPVKLWHGLIAENLSQGLARDIFSDMLLRLDAEGFKIIFHVHDEVVLEVDEADAEKTLARAVEIMSVPPSWIPDIPLAAEGEILDFYKK